MKDPISDRVKNVPPSGIRRYFDLAAKSKNIVSLGVGEPDFDTPYEIKELAARAIELNRTHYTSNSGLFELRNRISEKLARENNIQAENENILITAGSSEGLDIVLRALLDPRDEVLIPEPCYVAYEPLTMLAGGKAIFVPSKEENEFRVTVDGLKAAASEKSKALLICSPNNPTGGVLRKSDLEEIADFAVENDLVVISDEIYEKLIYEEKHVSIASLNGMAERTITLNGFSKAFACTGWRVGYIAGPEKLIAPIRKIHQYNLLCAPSISQYAMLAAFEPGIEESVDSMVRAYDRRRRLLVGGLNKLPGIECHMPAGAFYAFPNISGTGMSDGEFTEKAITDAEVAVVPGSVFGPSGKDHVRCSYSVSASNITKALERLGDLLS